MCLYSKDELRKAKRDIICYKVLEHIIDKDLTIEIFNTPCTKTFVDIKENFKATGIELISVDYDETIMYSMGFIHTYKNIKDAIHYIEAINSLTSNLNTRYEIYKCIIPKDIIYVEGKTANDRSSYASKEIKFIEEIII